MPDFVQTMLDEMAAERARLEGVRIDAGDDERERLDAHLSALRKARRVLTGESAAPRGYDELSDDEIIEAIHAGRDVFPRTMPTSKRQARRRGARR